MLDLAKLKTPPGEYTIAFYGNAVAKYRPQQDVGGANGQSDAVKTTDIVDIIVSEPI